MAACGTKKTFVTTWQAEMALQRIKRDPRPDLCGGNIPIRWYQCHACGFYHLTHYALGESRWERAQAVRGAFATEATAALKVAGYDVTPVAEQKPVLASGGWTPERKAQKSEAAREYWRKIHAGELPMPKVGRKGQNLKNKSPEHLAKMAAAAQTPERRALSRDAMLVQLAAQTPEELSRKGREARAIQLATQTPEQKAAIAAKKSEATKDRPLAPEHRANIAKAMQEREQKFGKAELARLFLERLPMMTTEERRAVVRLFG